MILNFYDVKLKQQYNLEHIFIGEFNAINYIFR